MAVGSQVDGEDELVLNHKSVDDVAVDTVNATKERIARAIAHTSFATMRAQEERDGFDERSPAQKRFFRKGVAGGWREALTSQQARRSEADHGEQMRRYGYLPAEAAP